MVSVDFDDPSVIPNVGLGNTVSIAGKSHSYKSGLLKIAVLERLLVNPAGQKAIYVSSEEPVEIAMESLASIYYGKRSVDAAATTGMVKDLIDNIGSCGSNLSIIHQCDVGGSSIFGYLDSLMRGTETNYVFIDGIDVLFNLNDLDPQQIKTYVEEKQITLYYTMNGDIDNLPDLFWAADVQNRLKLIREGEHQQIDISQQVITDFGGMGSESTLYINGSGIPEGLFNRKDEGAVTH